MFKFQKDFYKNGQGLHLKTILFSVLASIIMTIIMLIPGAAFLIGVITMSATQNDITGEPSGAGVATFIISMIIGLILSLVVYIFILIPMAYGMLKYYKDTDLSRTPRFKDLFMFLKKGNYVKTLKLTLIIFVLSVAIYIIIYIVVFIVEIIFFGIFGTSMAIMQPDSSGSNVGVMSISLIILILFMIVVMLAIFIPIYYIIIFIANTILVHVDQRSLPTFTKLSIGWNITSKGPNSAWKLLFSNLLYFIIAYIILAVISIIALLIISLLPTVLQIICGVILYIISIVYLIAISYLVYGSVVNFYHKNKNALYPPNN